MRIYQSAGRQDLPSPGVKKAHAKKIESDTSATKNRAASTDTLDQLETERLNQGADISTTNTETFREIQQAIEKEGDKQVPFTSTETLSTPAQQVPERLNGNAVNTETFGTHQAIEKKGDNPTLTPTTSAETFGAQALVESEDAEKRKMNLFERTNADTFTAIKQSADRLSQCAKFDIPGPLEQVAKTTESFARSAQNSARAPEYR